MREMRWSELEKWKFFITNMMEAMHREDGETLFKNTKVFRASMLPQTAFNEF